MQDAVVVINAGSSSIKFGVFLHDGGEPELVERGQMEGIGSDPSFAVKNADGETIFAHDEWPRGSTLTHLGAIRFILDYLAEHGSEFRIVGAGHRVVHGGSAFTRPVIVTPEVTATLATLVPLAPLHQPHNLAAIRAVTELHPELPQVACFDTAFHATQPRVAQLFALPRDLLESGVRRYGFHGLSYEYISRRLPEFDGKARRVVVAHLGSGASMCAIKDGQSIESSMGFTAVDGLPMGTRTGALDPGVLLYLMQERHYDARAIERLLYKDSGLLGLSGISNDMRDLANSNDPRAQEAIDYFIYQVGKFLGALAAALGGLDALVFTAGIGENDRRLRRRVCEQAAWLGIELDAEANEHHGPRISAEASPVSVWVIPTNEERMIARHTLDLVAA
jgi:acetate kinase